MTDAPRCVDEQSRAVVEVGTEQASAARRWLLQAARRPHAARVEWQEQGIALLECGEVFTVAAIQPEVIWAAAGTNRLPDVDAYLARALHGRPVFMSLRSNQYYALLPASAADRFEWTGQVREDARLLGAESVIGVPRPDTVTPQGHASYWCVPMSGAGYLCSPDALSQLLAHGRFILASRKDETPCP